MTTTESLRNWFLKCPKVQEVTGFNADYLGDVTGECTIYSLPTALQYDEDIAGNITFRGVQTFNFYFALRAPYSDDVTQNLKNLEFFEKVKSWMYDQNLKKDFPLITEGPVRSIMPKQTEYVAGATADTAMYQMLCELKYWREA